MLFCCVYCLSVLLLELLTVATGHTSSNGGHFFSKMASFTSVVWFCLVLFAPTVNLSNFILEVLTVGDNPSIINNTIHSPRKAAGLTVFTFSLHSRPSIRFKV